MKVFYGGSFCPPTLGHEDIIRRAANLFDEVVVAVMVNPAKQYAISMEERVSLLQTLFQDVSNVRVIADDGLLVDAARREGADALLRGIRGVSDLPFEMQLAEANRRLSGLETLYLQTLPEYSLLCSSVVLDVARHGGSVDGMVPALIKSEILRALAR